MGQGAEDLEQRFYAHGDDGCGSTMYGHNNPPDPIAEALAAHDAVIAEAQNWTDGEKVDSEAQMKEVDALIKGVKLAKKDVGIAEKSATAPLYDTWKEEKAKWKPTIDDLDLLVKALVATVDPFKRKLAAEKQEAERKAWEKANKARLEAEEKARKADAADLEAQRDAQPAQADALEADKAARAAKADKPKGLRTVKHFEILDYAAAWASIPQPEKIAIVTAWVEKNHKALDIAGVKQWQTKEAF